MVCVSKRLFDATLLHICTSNPICQSFSGVSLIAIHVYSMGNRGSGYLDKGLLDREGRDGSKSPNALILEEIY